jgi:hypothetical protein
VVDGHRMCCLGVVEDLKNNLSVAYGLKNGVVEYLHFDL